MAQLRFDYQLHVHLWSVERDLLVTFSTPLMLHPPADEARTFDPEQSVSLYPLLSLLHRSAAEFAVSSEGGCVLRFKGKINHEETRYKTNRPASRLFVAGDGYVPEQFYGACTKS